MGQYVTSLCIDVEPLLTKSYTHLAAKRRVAKVRDLLQSILAISILALVIHLFPPNEVD